MKICDGDLGGGHSSTTITNDQSDFQHHSSRDNSALAVFTSAAASEQRTTRVTASEQRTTTSPPSIQTRCQTVLHKSQSIYLLSTTGTYRCITTHAPTHRCKHCLSAGGGRWVFVLLLGRKALVYLFPRKATRRNVLMICSLIRSCSPARTARGMDCLWVLACLQSEHDDSELWCWLDRTNSGQVGWDGMFARLSVLATMYIQIGTVCGQQVCLSVCVFLYACIHSVCPTQRFSV